jgi:MFS transporter, PHS family, inorganic phosphate transporter
MALVAIRHGHRYEIETASRGFTLRTNGIPGIGAEYPLSAVITSEWSSTKSRATMISSVFMMQPIGQALAQLVGLWVLLGREDAYQLTEMQCGLNTKYTTECRRIVDGIWRIVIGSGAIPALLAIIFRFFLFDCGLYSLEVKNNPGIALRNTQKIYGAPPVATNNGFSMGSPNGVHSNPTPPMPIQFSKENLYQYFIQDGNWYYLLGKSILEGQGYCVALGPYGAACTDVRTAPTHTNTTRHQEPQ